MPNALFQTTLFLDFFLVGGDKIEVEGEAQGVGQRVILLGGDQVGDIDTEDAVLDTGANGKELAVAFILALVEIAETHEEEVTVAILSTLRPHNLTHLLLETERGIIERLNHALRHGYVGIHTGIDNGVSGIVIHNVSRHAVDQIDRICRDQQFVDFTVDSQLVVAVEVHLVTDTQLEVGGQEVTAQCSRGIGHLVAHVGNAQSGTQRTVLKCFDVKILLVEEGDVSGTGHTSSCLLTAHKLAGGQVRIDEARRNGDGELVDQLARIGEVNGELIGILGAHQLTLVIHEFNVTQGEVTQRHGNGVHIGDAPVTGEVGQIDIVHQLAQPGAVRDAETESVLIEDILRRVVALGVGVGRGGTSDVTHGTGTAVRGDG